LKPQLVERILYSLPPSRRLATRRLASVARATCRCVTLLPDIWRLAAIADDLVKETMS
jgi:hypothetical protein